MKKRILAMLLCLAMAMQMTSYVGANEDMVWDIVEDDIVLPTYDEYPEEFEEIEEITEDDIVIGEIEEIPEDDADAEAEEDEAEEEVFEEIEEITEDDMVLGEEVVEEEVYEEVVEEVFEFESVEMEAETFWASGSDEEEADGELVVSKTVSPDRGDGDDEFTIHLEAYATGSATTVTHTPIPSDIVLVIDQSGSMNDCIACGHEVLGNSESILDTNENKIPDCTEYIKNNPCKTKVFGSDIDKTKYYLVVYKDGTVRKIDYCETCQAWYTASSEAHFGKNPTHSGWAKWTPLTYDTEGSSYNDGVEHKVQFYKVCEHDTTRMKALKGAVSNFLEELYKDSLGQDGQISSDDVLNRVAIVGYSNSGSSKIYTSNNNGTSATTSEETAANAFKSAITEKEIVNLGLSNVNIGGATATNEGVKAAELIFSKNEIKNGEERNRVVVLFTDGSPGSGYVNDKDWANEAITYAYQIKNNHKATIYTVGLYPGADATQPEKLPAYDVNENKVDNPLFYANGNRFLHLVSSNYPDAQSLDNTGSYKQGAEYYLATEDEEGLYNIFGKLSTDIDWGGTSISLDEQAVVKDIVTPYFTIPSGADSVTAWTVDCIGVDGDNNWEWASAQNNDNLSVTVVDRTVTVTNFDFAENYVHVDENNENGAAGKKLVIEIKIKPNEDFLGGDDVITNDPASGIYPNAESTDAVIKFQQPKVDVTVKEIVPKFTERHIYVSQQVDFQNILNLGIFGDNGQWKVDGINNAYVDIKYTVADASNKKLTYTIPAGTALEGLTDQGWNVDEGLNVKEYINDDTTYTLSCEIISTIDKTNSSYEEQSTEVWVYKPEITFRDSEINLGETADYADNQDSTGNVIWKHEGVPAADDDTRLSENPPVLDYTYNPIAGAFTKDTPVQVTVTSQKDEANNIPDDMDITQYTTFYRDACDFTDECPDDKSIVLSSSQNNSTMTYTEWVNFIVHINSFQLKIIKKAATGTTFADGETFLFTVKKGNEVVAEVMVVGGDSVTLTGLPIGTYTITENTDWSWRYNCTDDITKEVKAPDNVDENGVAEVAFTNELDENKWLDGSTYAKNTISWIGNDKNHIVDENNKKPKTNNP